MLTVFGVAGIFWSVVVVSAFVTGACSYVSDSNVCRIYLAVGTGIQGMCTLYLGVLTF